MQEWQGPAKQAACVGAPIPPTVRLSKARLRWFPSQQVLQPFNVDVLLFDVAFRLFEVVFRLVDAAILYDVSQITLEKENREQTEIRTSFVDRHCKRYAVVARLTQTCANMVSPTVTNLAVSSGRHESPALKSRRVEELQLDSFPARV